MTALHGFKLSSYNRILLLAETLLMPVFWGLLYTVELANVDIVMGMAVLLIVINF